MNVEDFQRFCTDYDVQPIVLSRDRADVLATHTDRLLRNYKLFYSGDGYDEREYVGAVEKIEVPRELRGRSVVANYALRHLDNRIVIILGDDAKDIVWLGEDKLRRIDAEGVMVMTVNLVITALDAGAGLFGISEVDIRKASPLEPFHVRRMVTGFVGLDRSKVPPIWFDERQVLKEDYDFCLEHLKRDRFVLKDLRYFYSQDRNVLPGGNMGLRTPEREEAEVQNLKDWWGDDMVRFTDGRQTKHLRIIV